MSDRTAKLLKDAEKYAADNKRCAKIFLEQTDPQRYPEDALTKIWARAVLEERPKMSMKFQAAWRQNDEVFDCTRRGGQIVFARPGSQISETSRSLPEAEFWKHFKPIPKAEGTPAPEKKADQGSLFG